MAQLDVSRVAGLSSSVAKMVKGYRHVGAIEARLLARGQEAFNARLKRTALGLPTATVSRAMRDMHRRVQLVLEEKGGMFNE